MDDLLDHKLLSVSFSVDDNVVPIFVDTGKLVIRELMEYLVTSGEVTFRDTNSYFMSKRPFFQDSIIQVTIQDDDNMKQVAFRPFADTDLNVGASGEYDCTLDMISKYADPILTMREFHSKRCKASDYVKYIADKLKLKFDIEDSKDEKAWINPNWKLGQMLRHLAVSSISSKGSSGYMYYITYDGVLTFKTVDKFFEDAVNEETINFSYGTNIIQQAEIRKGYFSSVLFGANYKDYNFYDLKNSTYSRNLITHDKFVKKRALKHNVSVQYSKEGGSVYSGIFDSDNGKPNSYERDIFLKTIFYIDSNTLVITVKADPFGRKLGNVVNVNIPIESEDKVNISLSGRYLIKGIVTKGIQEFFQTLILVRPGINYNDKDNLL